MKKMKILAAVGDFYHQEKMCRRALEKANQQLLLDIEYISENRLVERLQGKTDLVILFKGNKLNPKDPNPKVWMDEDAAIAIAQYVAEGGSWFAWHSGLASYDVKTYVDMLRGYFNYHPKISPITYIAVKDNDVIDSDLTYEMMDEHYFIDCDVANTNVFLRSESKDGKSVAGWAHNYGKGRVLCLTPAHLEEGLLHPETTKMIVQSIKWCIGGFTDEGMDK